MEVAMPAAKKAPKAVSAPKVILLVDDEMSVLMLVKKILEDSGYAVDAAVSGEQALRKLREIRPNLVILDMMMPGLSGLDVCKRIRQTPEWQSIHVMFLTVMRRTKEVEEDLKLLNVSDYVEKPFSVEDLLARVKAAVS